MSKMSSEWIIFASAIVVFCAAAIVLAIYAGVDLLSATLWSISGVLGVYYPGLVSDKIGDTSAYILLADLALAFAFVLTTAFSSAFFFNFLKSIALWKRNVARRIRKLRGHTIIMPLNRFTTSLIRELDVAGAPVVVIADNDKEARHLYAKSRLVVVGDASNIDVLQAAGLQNAGAVILCSDNPIENTIVALTVRTFNKHVKIISRVSKEEDLVTIGKTGAQKLILPEVDAGADLGNVIRNKIIQG